MATKNSSGLGRAAAPVTMFAHLLGIAVAILVLVWVLHFREGLAFKSHSKPKIFNVHPLLMIIGFILPAGEAIMAYKTVPATRKVQKLVHFVLLFIALLAGILGVYAVFKFLNELKHPSLCTLHSWIGMATICLFGLQWLLSFFSFSWPGAGKGVRERLIPYHVCFGAVIFLMAILSAETGLVERFTFLGLRRSQEALIMNFTGLLVLFFGIAVGLSLLLPANK